MLEALQAALSEKHWRLSCRGVFVSYALAECFGVDHCGLLSLSNLRCEFLFHLLTHTWGPCMGLAAGFVFGKPKISVGEKEKQKRCCELEAVGRVAGCAGMTWLVFSSPGS